MNHVLYLVSHLRRVRELHLQEGTIQVTAENTPLQRETQRGDITAIYFCWEKTKQRFRKDSRDERFVRLVADVLDGPPADQRADCDGEEKRTLKAVQDCSGADRERFQHVGESIAFITQHFEHKRSRVEGEGGRYKIPEADRHVLIELRLDRHNIYSVMEEGRHLWPLCTDYIRGQLLVGSQVCQQTDDPQFGVHPRTRGRRMPVLRRRERGIRS